MKVVIKMKSTTLVFGFFMFGLSTISQSETLPVVGKLAELIMEHGDVSVTECGKKYERRWKFCTSTVELTEPIDKLEGYVGIWECSRYLNDSGVHLNIVCRRQETKY